MIKRALSSETFGFQISASGVVLTAQGKPLFPAVLSEELFDSWVGQMHAELASVAAEATTALRRQLEQRLSGDRDAHGG